MAHALLSTLRRPNSKEFHDLLVNWKILDPLNTEWPDRDRSIKEALLQQLHMVFQVWATATKKPDAAAAPVGGGAPEASIVSRFFSAFVWFMTLGKTPRTTAIHETVDDSGSLEELAQPIYLTNLCVQGIKRSCPEVMGPSVETLVQNLIVTIQNTVAYLHNLYETMQTPPIDGDVDGLTKLIKLTEMRMAKLLGELDVQLDIPEHMLTYLFYLLRSACHMGLYIIQWRRLVLGDAGIAADDVVQNICSMSTGSGKEVLDDIGKMIERDELLVLDSFYSRFLFVVQYIENYTRLSRESKDRKFIKYPHSTIVMAPKKPVFKDSKVMADTNRLITAMERCMDNQQIVWQVRDWLRESGYGERQYIASSVAKKRERGWSTMEP